MKGTFSSTQGFIDSLSGIDLMLKKEATTAPLDKIQPDPNQPRKAFDQAELENLAGSIRANGVVSAIGVLSAENGVHTIVYGERRWRAAKLAGLSAMPIVIIDPSKVNVRAIQLVENIQRSRLSAEEIAAAIDDLAQGGMKATDIASQLGMSKARVSEYRAVMEMPPPLRSIVNDTGAQIAYQLFGLWKRDQTAVEAFLSATPAGNINRAAVARMGDAVNGSGEGRSRRSSAATEADSPVASQYDIEVSDEASGKGRRAVCGGPETRTVGNGDDERASPSANGPLLHTDAPGLSDVAHPHFIVQVGAEFGRLLVDRSGPDSKTALVAFNNGSEVRHVRLSELSIFEIVGS